MAKPTTYWDKRAVRRLTEAEKQGEAYSKRIRKIYDQANKNIQRDIENIYANYSKATGMDVQSLKTLLTKTQTDKLWDELRAKGLDQYVKGNYKARITRLEQLQAQIYAKAKEVYPQELKEQTACYSDVLNDSYYKAIYDTQMGTGWDFAFSTLDDNLVKAVLSERWSGKNYSQRIWGNTDLLAESVSEIVGGALLSGQSYAKTSRQIRERFNVSKYYADRLVRTECNHFHNQADAMAYEEMDVEKYVFLAVLDTRTSKICQSYDNKAIDLKDKQEGVNFPPLHPNCRSTTRAYMGEEIEKTLKRRARNPKTGENEIIDNMSYEEWAEKHGLNKPKTAPKTTPKPAPKKAPVEKANIQPNNAPTRQVVNGVDLSGKIDYNNSGFDYDIETALHSQGYDGLPQIVEYDEFKDAMQKSNFYAERTYSGATPEQVNEFQDMLYNGKFYVDCSTGGAQYGQGMYCASCYDLTDSKSLGGIGWEMSHYQGLNANRGNRFAITEGITIQPDCKIFELPNGVKTDEYIPRIYRNNYLRTHAPQEMLPTVEKFISIDDQIEEIYRLGKIDHDVLDKLYVECDEARNQIPKSLFDESDEAMKYYPKGFEKWGKYKNAGTLVAEMGYDLIKATGHGQSGSYTVVLNRTKLIFCKGGSIYGN